MFHAIRQHPNLMGSLSALAAVFFFSINDMTIKFLSGSYALHQVVLIRSVIGMAVLLGVFLPLAKGATIKTKRLPLHLLRGFCVVFANMTFFMGLAVLPLAEGIAIFFVSPMIISVFSVIFLKEKVGPLRWVSIFVGLIGVVIVLRPGSDAFQMAALFPIAAAFGYACLHMLTRYIGRTEAAVTMTFYIQVTFVFVSLGIGLAVGDGRFAGSENASIDFFFRAWSAPAPGDWLILIVLGIVSAIAGFFISYAYRVAEAALVAPFEYVALPLAVFWGFFIFDDIPDLYAILGILLIGASGLFMIWRESLTRGAKVPDTPRYRR